jgi:serine protease Do
MHSLGHQGSRRWLSARGLLLLVLVALLGALAATALKSPVAAQFTAAAYKADPEAVRHAEGLSQAFRQASEMMLPTVVQIETHAKAKPPRRVDRTPGERPFRGGENPFRGTPFEDLFKDFDGRFEFDDDGMSRAPRDGHGSGVIIDRSGVILTNNHVVDGADEVVVRLHDGREFKSTKVRTDKTTDLALVWVDASNLPAARLGDSDRVQIGDWVLAIGQPFGLEATVSAGIISSKGRTLVGVKRTTFLQTDAAINPGNSGGPLVNLSGEVVGLNTAIYSRTGTFNGIGFAVPVNTAKWVADELMKHDGVRRAYLGAGISEITGEMAAKLGVQRRAGVLVNEVMKDSPAEKAGLQDQDIVLEFAGTKVTLPSELQSVVERSPIGKKQPVRILRGGKEMTLQVDPQPLPDKLVASRPSDDDQGDDSREGNSFSAKELGIEVSDMSPQVAKRLGYEGFAGVLISRVQPDRLAYRKGLREGMLVLKVGQTRVTKVEEFEAALKNESLKNGILLQVRTPNGNRFLVLKEL